MGGAAPRRHASAAGSPDGLRPRESCLWVASALHAASSLCATLKKSVQRAHLWLPPPHSLRSQPLQGAVALRPRITRSQRGSTSSIQKQRAAEHGLRGQAPAAEDDGPGL